MDLKYYVLGTKNNTMLLEYLEKYYNLLISYINALSQKGVLTQEFGELLKVDSKDFILNPDQSSIINLLHTEIVLENPQYLEDKSFYIEKLKNEITLFLKKDYDKMIMNKGEKIPGTNVRLTMIDNNPYNVFDAHPDHEDSGGKLGYGEKTESEWLEVYKKTFELLKIVDPGIYEELNHILKKIIPLGTAKETHNSASYKECIGHLYLGYMTGNNNPEIYNLEAIIHESSHNKINLIKQFDPIMLNDHEEKYYSAIRPDARHIHGVFIGYHAFAPSIYIVMKAYSEGLFGENKHLLEKLVLYHIKTKFLQKVVKKHAQLTPLGEEISKEIDYVITLMDQVFKKINPPQELIVRAKEKQVEHFKEVNSKYLNLTY